MEHCVDIVVKSLKPVKNMITVVLITFLAFAIAQNGLAQSTREIQPFYSNRYPGVSITVNATGEVAPDQNMTIKLWLTCTALYVTVNRFNVSIYGFINDTTKVLLVNYTFISSQTPLTFNLTNDYAFSVQVPSDVWGTTYTQLYLDYEIAGVQQPTSSPSFPTTTVENVYLEGLKTQLTNLNNTYLELNKTYWQLNSTYKALNASYWQLQKNYASLKSTASDLDNTRRVVGVLAVTTVFFVASTIYLMLRKPREPW